MQGRPRPSWRNHQTVLSPHSGRDCVKSLRSSYTGLYPQSLWTRRSLDAEIGAFAPGSSGRGVPENERERERAPERE